MRGEMLIPIFFFLSLAAVLTVYLLTRHRERVLMIEKGMKAEDINALRNRRWGMTSPFSSLKWGMLFVGVGLAGLIGLWLRESYTMNEGVIPALMCVFGGAALIVFYLVAKRKMVEQS